MKVDNRLVHHDQIDRTKSVLVDMHSLYYLTKELYDQHTPTFDTSQLKTDGGIKISNTIQTLVLYENIYVDALLFEIPSEVHKACELFPGIIHGLYIPPEIRHELFQNIQLLLNHIVTLDSTDKPPPRIDSQEWRRWMLQDSSEKPMLDKIDDISISSVPDEQELLRLLIMRPYPYKGLPLYCLNSMMTLGRAHFYLEFARYLNMPLSPDPIRSHYYKALTEKLLLNFRQGTPEKVIKYFEERVFPDSISEFRPTLSEELSIPAVTELVVNYAKKKRINLREATLEIRNSRNAEKFREWCARFTQFQNEIGRASLKEQSEMLQELKNVCDVWRKDVRDEVNYLSRKLNLEAIPIAGQILKTLGLHEPANVKTPLPKVLPKHPYFLFLNDLLRQSEEYNP